MKKIVALVGLSLIAVSHSFSQVNVTLNNVNIEPNFIGLRLPFFSLKFAPSNSTFFADFGGKAKFGGFMLNANYRIDYLNGLEEEMFTAEEPTADSKFSYKASKEFALMAGYMFLQKETSTQVTFGLKSSGKTKYVTKVPSKKTTFLMVDLGFKKGFTWVHCADKKLKFDAVTQPEGFTPPDPSKVRTMMDYSMLQFGISGGSMGFYDAQIEGYGRRTSKFFNRYYFDMLILLGSSVDPIYNKNTIGPNQSVTVYTQYELNNSPRSRVGFCLGAEMLNIRKFGIEGGVEAAYIPGIKGNFKSNFALTIRTNLALDMLLN